MSLQEMLDGAAARQRLTDEAIARQRLVREALARQQLSQVEAAEANDDALEALAGLAGEHAALLIIANQFFDGAHTELREQVLVPLRRDMSKYSFSQDDQFRESFKWMIESFCARLPPPLPPRESPELSSLR